MNKKNIISILLILSFLLVTACSNENKSVDKSDQVVEKENDETEKNNEVKTLECGNIMIQILF